MGKKYNQKNIGTRNIKGFIKKYYSIAIFFVIILVYFASANGLLNSIDTPQYYTTRALMENQNLDMGVYHGEPNYEVHPDYVVKDDQTLNFRGYLLSVISMPIHVVSGVVDELYSVGNYDDELTKNPNFKFELAVTSIFVLFTICGIFFIYLIIKEMTNNNVFVVSVVLILFAFSTYSWKYAATYVRHGPVIFFLGMYLYGLFLMYKDRMINKKGLLLVSLSIAFLFGIDLFLFGILGLNLLIFFISQKKLFKKYIEGLKSYWLVLLPATALIFVNVIFNFHWYDSPFFSLMTQQPEVEEIMEGDTLGVWLSSPMLPVSNSVLFNFGKLPESVFSNFDEYPPEIYDFTGAHFAKRYEFYGLFVISPLFLLAFIALLKNRYTKKYRRFTLICFSIFVMGVLLNSKVLNFWGGNQYDVRYFYAFLLCLTIPLAQVLHMFTQFKNRILKVIINILVLFTLGISVFMGWLGVINMYHPLRERKLFVDFNSIPSVFYTEEANIFVDATFPNRENLILAVLVFVFIFVYVKVMQRFIQIYWKED